MRYPIRIGVGSIFAAFVLAPSARAQSDVAYDFHMKETHTTNGNTKSGETTGHAIWSKGRLRFELTGSEAMPPIPGFTGTNVVMILPDTGRTMLVLQPEKKQYFNFNPSGMMDGVQKMMASMGATMTMEITGSDPKVEDLGAGPDFIGHHTRHFRISNNMKMRVGVIGRIQETNAETVSDEYVATDVPHLLHPFRGLASPMSDMFGASAKAYMDKVDAAKRKIPAGAPLHTETHMKGTSSMGGKTESNTVMDITKIQNITATANMFAVPAGYTQAQVPTMMPPNMRNRR